MFPIFRGASGSFTGPKKPRPEVAFASSEITWLLRYSAIDVLLYTSIRVFWMYALWVCTCILWMYALNVCILNVAALWVCTCILWMYALNVCILNVCIVKSIRGMTTKCQKTCFCSRLWAPNPGYCQISFVLHLLGAPWYIYIYMFVFVIYMCI